MEKVTNDKKCNLKLEICYFQIYLDHWLFIIDLLQYLV